jgi:Phage integrase family
MRKPPCPTGDPHLATVPFPRYKIAPHRLRIRYLGETVRANDAISQLQHLATRTYVPAIYMASVYTGLHDLDHALEWLDKAYDERCEYLVCLPTEPLADPLRGDPRFRKLLQRLRLKHRLTVLAEPSLLFRDGQPHPHATRARRPPLVRSSLTSPPFRPPLPPSWRTAWTKLRKVAGFADLGLHQLRHLFVTRMAEEGVPLPVTQAMVGHTTTEVTRRYTHISENAQRLAVEKLEETGKASHFVMSWKAVKLSR